MKINTGTLSTTPVETASRSNKMSFDASANAMLFNLLTGDLYSNPIGSIVREIASNCFDSHVEAGVDTSKNPVIVRLIDNSADGKQSFISFIDKGVGMNPDRMTNIYGNYFCSTKRDGNDQIGGFGLGGKTPLAYAPDGFYIITVSDKQDDIDFCKAQINALTAELESAENVTLIAQIKEEIEEFEQRLLTVSNINTDHIEYTYNVFIGENSPEFQMMNMKGTKAGKGTEVKVPIKGHDIEKFERNTLSQLYYFENIVFEGFSDRYVTNDYTLYKGKHFIFRGTNYSRKLHVVLGNVAYPINYEELELDEYKYDGIPIAVKLAIGELDGTGVTPSREAINHTPANVKIIKKKIELAIAELVEMLKEQNKSVQSLEQYYAVVDNIKYLNITDKHSINLGQFVVDNGSLDLVNFKYKEIPALPNERTILDDFYAVKMFGKKPTRYGRHYGENLESIKEFNNVYSVKDEFNRVVLKQAYLNHTKTTWYLHTPFNMHDDYIMKLMKKYKLVKVIGDPKTEKYDFSETGDYGNEYFYKYVVAKKKAVQLIKDLADDVTNIVRANTEDYDDLVVPKEYIELRKGLKKQKASAIKDVSIPAKVFKSNHGYQETIKIETLYDLKGSIVYGFSDDEDEIGNCVIIAGQLGMKISDSYNHPKQGMFFMRIAMNNEKYLKPLGRKAIHVKDFYKVFITRKIDKIVDIRINNQIYRSFHNVHNMFGHKAMELADQELYNDYHTIKNNLPKEIDLHWRLANGIKNHLGIDINDIEVDTPMKKMIDKLLEVSEKSSKNFYLLNQPYWSDASDEIKEQFVGLLSLCIVK